ncbi:MAG: undecaprenyldiphospho-muramoylpentapeptide beta-N-acetylglucosaminyltransferase [Oscillospiraceae bacterium]|nr:undecaprenyldiphospho-muramoylpentapeptide beta-N-acetylglucosaminyltransferase [Oscillospiraceae bacterium]
MKVLLAGGGTAGHINPALAIAGYIKERQPDAEILFVGTPWGMEAKLIPAAGYAFTPMKVAGIQRKLSLENIKRNAQALWYLINSGGRALEIVYNFSPDIAIGTGGYVSGPIMRRATQLGVPLIVHEQNAFPGITTKMLAPRAECVMLAAEDAGARIKNAKRIELTGNPIRGEVLSYDKQKAREELGLDSRPLVLSFGGSLGARAINEAMLPILIDSAKTGKYNHIHGYGQYGGFVPEQLKAAGVDTEQCGNLSVREYINDMPRVLAAADIVICRAGAITLSELQAKGKPSILIPSPNVAENHQYHNAMALAKRGAAKVIEESASLPEQLMEELSALADDRDKLREMSHNAHKMAITDACERIYNIAMGVIEANKER